MVVSGRRCHVSCTTRQLLQHSHWVRVCVCVQVAACVCVHVAFAVLPLHTHSTLIDPTASSNKGFDFQHDKRQSQSRAGRVGSIICFAKPTSQSVNQLVTQSVTQSYSQAVSQSASQLASQSTCEPLPCNWILNFIYCLRTVRSARLSSLCICLDNCYCQYTLLALLLPLLLWACTNLNNWHTHTHAHTVTRIHTHRRTHKVLTVQLPEKGKNEPKQKGDSS